MELYWLGYFIILAGGGGSLLWLLRYTLRTNHNRLINLILLILSLFLTFMALEFYFKVFFMEIDSAPTLARKNWEAYYEAGTFNSLGYRDIEWTPEMVIGKTKIMIVGDSFVKGVGIKYPADRFSNRLGAMLGDSYVVFNLGRSGANTKNEIEAIQEYPYPPDILIFSYFLNDIEGWAAWERGLERPPRTPISPYLAPVVKNSYALNFLYWRVVRLMEQDQPDRTWEWLRSLYDHPEVWWLHQQELLSIYEGTQSEKIPLIVLVFPAMNHLEASQPVTNRIVNLFREHSVPTIDAMELVDDMPLEARVVSLLDSHPSEVVHLRVATALHQTLMEMNEYSGQQ